MSVTLLAIQTQARKIECAIMLDKHKPTHTHTSTVYNHYTTVTRAFFDDSPQIVYTKRVGPNKKCHKSPAHAFARFRTYLAHTHVVAPDAPQCACSVTVFVCVHVCPQTHTRRVHKSPSNADKLTDNKFIGQFPTVMRTTLATPAKNCGTVCACVFECVCVSTAQQCAPNGNVRRVHTYIHTEHRVTSASSALVHRT